MRVLGRGLILGALIFFVVPASAQASPVLVGSSDDPLSCTGIVGDTTLNCSLFSLGSLSGSASFELSFESDQDVALFAFSIGADSDFLALTSSLGLDTMLGLFTASDGLLYSYSDPLQGETLAFGTDIDPFAVLSPVPDLNDQLGGFVLSADTDYYLAVLLNTSGANGFSGDPTSLSAPFACDDAALCSGGGGTFTLTLSAISDEQPQPVPEPGTLTLIAGGALAGLTQRRRLKKRNRSESVSR